MLLSSLDKDHVPAAMPCSIEDKDTPHRPKIVPFNPHIWITLNACGSRLVSKKALFQIPGTQASMKAGWDRLRSKVVWDETYVREWSDVAKEAQDARVEVNFGYLFGICDEKNSELQVAHPKHELTGRMAFQGNRVLNQSSRTGELLYSKIWDLVLLPWGLAKLLFFTA